MHEKGCVCKGEMDKEKGELLAMRVVCGGQCVEDGRTLDGVKCFSNLVRRACREQMKAWSVKGQWNAYKVLWEDRK